MLYIDATADKGKQNVIKKEYRAPVLKMGMMV
jgi:hypothetical protein